MRRHSLTFTATTLNAWVCPGGVTEVEVEGYGGGSGGAGGMGGNALTNLYPMGGAGGAGSWKGRQVVPVTPGVSYDAVIGAAGAGGIAAGNTNVAPDPGLPGGDTLFRVNGGAILATFQGASHTGYPVAANTITNSATVYHGAQPTRQRNSTFERGDDAFVSVYVMNDYAVMLQADVPGAGGAGTTNNNFYRDGRDSKEGYFGGPHGSRGANGAGNYKGGGPGGGGGAGPGGDGGYGGTGTAGNGAGTTTDAQAGGSASANTGAGGGGGGAAGCASSAPSGNGGGGGGDGGSGLLTLIWYV